MKKERFPFAALIAAAALFASCANPSSEPADPGAAPAAAKPAAVTGIELDASSLELYCRDGRALVAKLSPADAADKRVSWSSDDASVAEVDSSGKVTAKAAGAATITARAADGGFAASCAVTVRPHVYAAGSAASGSGYVPGYWLDGAWLELPTPIGATDGEVKAIAVSGGRVYAGGDYCLGGGDYEPAYWVDGSFVELPRLWPGKGGRVLSIAIADGHVYAGGYSVSLVDKRIPGYWLDGIWQGLASSQAEGTSSAVTALLVSGGKVYAAGVKDSIPGYWVDGAWIALEAEAKGYVYCLLEAGGSLYAGGAAPTGWGTSSMIPCYWKDGARTDLPVASGWSGYLLSLAAANGSLCAAGEYFQISPRTLASGYWIEGERRSLDPPAPGTIATADLVAASGGRLYCFGIAEGADGSWNCGYWLDGAWKELPLPSGYAEGEVYSVSLYE